MIKAKVARNPHVVGFRGRRSNPTSAVVAVMLALTACVATVAHPPTDAARSQEIKSGVVAPGRARLVAYKGKVTGSLIFWDQTLAGTGELIINGIDVGGVNPGEAIAVDLTPGSYSITWTEVGPDSAPSFPSPVRLGPGDVVYLSMDQRVSTGPYVGQSSTEGNIAVQSSGLAVIQGMTIVSPKPAAQRLISLTSEQ